MHGNDMKPTPDEELVAHARTGDVGAFTQLVERYRVGALRLAYGIAGTEAEDAVQEAFVKAYRRLDTFRPDATFRPWLFTIVANEARNRRRSMSRRISLELRVKEQPIVLGAASDTLAAEHEQRRRLVAAVNNLSEPHREVVALRYFAGLSERETAAVLACPPGTAKSRLSARR
jgi:RNA polymerase sigma-70 factor (ECF subfamily)